MKRKSQKAKHAAHAAHAERVAGTIRIKKSRIRPAGGGAFAGVDIARGACVGFYAGARMKTSDDANYDYSMEGGPGGRDGTDPNGRLQLEDGSLVNIHGYNKDDWEALASPGVAWVGETANWTRFINHASAAHQNLSLCATSERFGRSHAFYAKRPIAAGEELYFSYQAGYWKSRGIVPEDPPEAARIPPTPPTRAL